MTHRPIRVGCVVKGFAGGHVVVIGHYHEQEDLSNSDVGKEDLSHATLQGGGFDLGQKVCEKVREEVWNDHWGQIAKEERPRGTQTDVDVTTMRPQPTTTARYTGRNTAKHTLWILEEDGEN